MRHENEFLPEPLSADPFALFSAWLTDARQRNVQPNPNAMVLATVDTEGNPRARVVLCKHVIEQPGYLVFFTNYLSDKGHELDGRSRAAAVFHWDPLHRQVRMTGPVLKSPTRESDEYFAVRPLASQIGAWASRQSEPLSSRAQLTKQVEDTMRRFNVSSTTNDAPIPRPPHWGGFRLWPNTIELWVEGPGRVHDRAVWKRDVRPQDEFTMSCGPWSATRLNP